MESKDSKRWSPVSRDLSSFFPIPQLFPHHRVNTASAVYFQTWPVIKSFDLQNAHIQQGTAEARWRYTFATWWSNSSRLYCPWERRWHEECTPQERCQSSLSFSFPINMELPSLRVWGGFILGRNLSWHLVALVSLCTFSGFSSDCIRTSRGPLYRCDKSFKGCSFIDRYVYIPPISTPGYLTYSPIIFVISVLQRLAVATSCVLFYLLFVKTPITQVVDIALLVSLAVLACVEKLGSIMNLISVERDWVRIANMKFDTHWNKLETDLTREQVVVVAGNNHDNLQSAWIPTWMVKPRFTLTCSYGFQLWTPRWDGSTCFASL